MPVGQTSHVWIERPAQASYQQHLRQCQTQGHGMIWPLIGAGGMGKSSLLLRFFKECEQNGTPCLFLPRLDSNSALDMLLQVQARHTPTFLALRDKLRAGYESLSALLKEYGQAAGSAAELAQKSLMKDEDLGLVVGTVRDSFKVLGQFWQRKENKDLQEMMQKPEQALWQALAKDFAGKGVMLVDTLEQTGHASLHSRLLFLPDGNCEAALPDHSLQYSLLAYLGGMAHYLLDKPLLMIFAGRPPARRQIGDLPGEYFAATTDLQALRAEEVKHYLRRALPAIPAPDAHNLALVLQITNGNPHLLAKFTDLLRLYGKDWQWRAEQMQPLQKSFIADERYGLLQYVTERLATHTLPEDKLFWRLCLPRQAVHREMAAILFGTAGDGVTGEARLRHYLSKGIVFQQDFEADWFYLHDETRAALNAWARRHGYWEQEETAQLHMALCQWFDKQTGWPLGFEDVQAEIDCNGQAFLLEAAYHQMQADTEFEQRYPGKDAAQFFSAFSSSLSVTNAEKRRISWKLEDLSQWQIDELALTFSAEIAQFRELLQPETCVHLMELGKHGRLPVDWTSNKAFLHDTRLQFPSDPAILWLLCSCVDNDEADLLYRQAIAADDKHARNLENYAIFLHLHRRAYPQAINHYQQALAVNPAAANAHANLSQLLLAAGDLDAGRAHMAQAFAQTDISIQAQLELWLYRYAHFPAEWPQAPAQILELLCGGERSPGWDFSPTLDAAQAHPAPDLLHALAAVILDQAPLSSLAPFFPTTD